MNFVKEISNKTVSISEFNRGLAGRIFDDVKINGAKVVLKNNSPECVLISPQEYTDIIDQLEDLKDLMVANERLSSAKEEDLISKEQFEKLFNFDFEEISPISEDEIE
ncbi:MAG: type II toxin-antitoxin system Phd/YefM family antitoxin [Finegoldia sp.]|nr:type II toxin-antitoxin system Phd/YefM family antitoxin [Finegoldia sp.]